MSNTVKKKIRAIRVVKAGSAPDVDTDFHTEYRELAADHCEEIYGRGTVASINTFQTLAAKAAIKIMCTIYSVPFAQANKIAALVPDVIEGVLCTVDDIFNPDSDRYAEAADFRTATAGDEWIPIIAGAKAIEGRVRAIGIHPCGIVMSNQQLIDIVPLTTRWSKKDEKFKVVTQWTYPELEAMGLIKFDFLGLDTVDLIAHSVEYIMKNGKTPPNMVDLIHGPMDDKKTYELIGRGETEGIFQLASDGVKKLLKLMKPTELGDIVATTALFRPGPMGMNSHIKYAKRKNGSEKVEYPIHPDFKGTELEKILGKTYGLCVPVGTEIFDSVSGLYIPIEDVIEGETYTTSWSETSGFEPERVEKLIATGKKKILEIAVNGSRTLRVSETHPVLTQRGFVEAGQLVAGDMLMVNNTAQEPQQPDNGDFTVDRAYFLGAMLGDGSMTSNSSPYFTNSSSQLNAAITQIVENEFSNIKVTVTPRCREGEVYTSHTAFYDDGNSIGKSDRGQTETAFDRHPIQQWFKSIGYDGKFTMDEKTITDAVMAVDNKLLLQVVAGLWDTDGCVSHTNLHYTTTSLGLYTGMQKMLQRLGVDYSVSISPSANKKRKDRTTYRIMPNRFDFKTIVQGALRSAKANVIISATREDNHSSLARIWDRAIEEFNLWLKSNQNELIYLSDSSRSSLVTGQKALASKAIITFLTNKGYDTSTLKKSINSLAGIGALTPETLQLLNARWRRVETITEAGFEDCYDIEVRKNHTFLVNNFVVHNCVFQEQIIQIANVIGGMTLQQGDDLRKAMGKKDKLKMGKAKPLFIEGGLEKGHSSEALETLWETMAVFAEYGFNKCLDGKTLVSVENEGKIFIKDLYKRMEESAEPVKILSHEPDGSLAYHQVKTVVNSGLKPLYKIRTESGRVIRVTKDHRLLTASNGYGTIADGKLAVGTELIVDENWNKRLAPETISKENTERHKKSLAATGGELFKSDRGLGSTTKISNGELCASMCEAWAAEYLLARGVEFELHKKFTAIDGIVREADFYVNGSYLEMDSLGRGADWFKKEKYGESIPFVYMTPLNYKDVIDEFLMADIVGNGDPIVSIESPKTGENGEFYNETTFDIEMEDTGPSNFIANGIVSHNSHSVAYAINAYQAAYLKANYPVEFMAALLAQNVGKKDKILPFIQEARRMGLNLGSVDINHSDIKVAPDYTGASKFDILYGISGINAVSQDMAELIVRERVVNGLYESVQNLIDRCYPLGVTNRKIYENLAKAGAFDVFGLSRKGIVENLANMISDTKESQAKGDDLFSLFGGAIDTPVGVDLSLLDDYGHLEKLRYESEVIGLYLTDHPLSRVGSLSGLRSAPLSKILLSTSQSTHRVVGAVTEVVIKRQKRGGKSVAITIDDGTGLIKGFVNRDIVRGMDKFVAQAKVKELYIRGATELPLEIEAAALDDSFSAIEEIEVGQVYSMELAFRPGNDEDEYNARIGRLHKINLAADGSLPVRLRLPKPTTQEQKKDQMIFLKTMAAKFPGDSPVFAAYQGSGDVDRESVFLDAVDAIHSSTKRAEAAEVTHTHQQGLMGTVSTAIKKGSKASEPDERAWPPPKQDRGPIGKAARVPRFSANSIETMAYKQAPVKVDKSPELARFIEDNFGIENYDFGIFNANLLEDNR